MTTIQPTKRNHKPLIWGLTIGINLLIVIAFFIPAVTLPKEYDFSFLPRLNALLNSLTFVSLLAAYFAIRKKKITLHRNLVFTALTFTSVFLCSYLLYHFTVPSTEYGGTGLVKGIYFFILITHISLAALVVPLALITISRGLNMDVARHRKIARWVMPIWLYVSLTGVIVYLMISPYYH